jgi:hypothetical protein
MVTTEGPCSSVTNTTVCFFNWINDNCLTKRVGQCRATMTPPGFSEPYFFSNRINEK